MRQLLARWCVFLSCLCLLWQTAQAASPIIRYDSIHHPIRAEQGMVATQHALASQVGVEILKSGGNAVDAAVAVGFALAVVLPRAGNLGGGGFMLVHMAEQNGEPAKTVAIDYREMAPMAAHRDLFLDDNGEVDKNKSRLSHAAAGVPGTVAGLVHAQQAYGRLSLRQVIQPAIKLASDGFAMTYDLADKLKKYKHLRNNPETLKVFYRKNGEAYTAGDRFRQLELAWSLKQIARQGEAAFYTGKIAERIVAEMSAQNGLITAADLANYRVVEREPVMGTYRGYQVASMPPPSSGGVHLLQMLNTLEAFDLTAWGANSAKAVHHQTEAMKWAYADRSKHLGDPDFVAVPVNGLIDKTYGQLLAQRIKPEQATPSTEILPREHFDDESRDTTHYSIIDADGNAVSNTYTLNFSFGSGITVPGTGILLNNEMDDFSAKPGVPNAYGLIGGEANAVAAGKRPLSSMTPTIVLRDGVPFLVTGSPGGSRIITTVLQSIINVVDHGMNVAEAVHQPRMHHQWQPDKLFVEPGFNADTVRMLEAKGHEVVPSRTMGSVNAVLWDGQHFFGAADPRKPDASAVGY